MGDLACNITPLEVKIEASSTTAKQENKYGQPKDEDHSSKESPRSSILTKIHAGYFRIGLSLGGQALLWKILSEYRTNNDSPDVEHVFHYLPSTAFLLVWWLALLTQVLLSVLYLLRCFFYFHMVKAEFFHHIRVNFFYAPWISFLLLLQSSPMILPTSVYFPILFWVFSIPLLMLNVKIYGQWFTTEKRFLSVFANPTSQISVIGNFVVARAAAKMECRETAVCMFSLGIVHYVILFITLYQRLSGVNRFPAVLRPAFFLFVAAPSMGSLAWYSISGVLDVTSKMLFFLSVFLFLSLACRPALFKKSMKKFHIAWWGYSFPTTILALASLIYAREIKGHVAPALMLLLLASSVLVFLGLMLLTAANTSRLVHEDDPLLNFTKSSKSRTPAAAK